MNPTTKIPEMPKDEIVKWSKTITPIIRKDKKRFLLTNLIDTDLTDIAYPLLSNTNKVGNSVNITKLHVIDDIVMYSENTNAASFCPTFAEVVKQIPKDLIQKVSSFEIIHCLDELIDNHHVALVRLYGN